MIETKLSSAGIAQVKEQGNKVHVFIDEDQLPLGEYIAPFEIELDTKKLNDGKHTLKVVAIDDIGQKGIKIINFIVRNGPHIDVDGLSENDRVDGSVNLMINAYGRGTGENFIVTGAETPKGILTWIWVIILLILAWAIFYLIRNWNF